MTDATGPLRIKGAKPGIVDLLKLPRGNRDVVVTPAQMAQLEQYRGFADAEAIEGGGRFFLGRRVLIDPQPNSAKEEESEG